MVIMMKKTQIIELFKDIKSSLVSFIAITIFVLLGVALYLGIGWTATSIDKTADNEFDKYNLYDLEILFPYGFDSEDLKSIESIPGISDVEGSYYYSAFFDYKGINRQAKVVELTERFSKTRVESGTMPKNVGEAAINKAFADSEGLKVGDVITFSHDEKDTEYKLSDLLSGDLEKLSTPQKSPDGMSMFTTDKVVITAIINSPYYTSIYPITFGAASNNSALFDCVLFVPSDTFDKSSFAGYVDTFIDVESGKNIDEVKKEVISISEKLAKNKNDKIIDTGNKLVEDLNSRLSDAKNEIAEGEKKLADSKAEILRNKKKLIAGQKELDANKKTLSEYEKTLNEKKNELKSAEELFAIFDRIYKLYRSFYDNNQLVPNELYVLAKDAYDDGTLDTIKNLIANNKKYISNDLILKYNDFYNKMSSGYYESHKDELVPILSDLNKIITKLYNEALSKLKDARAQILDYESQIAAAKKQIDDAQKKINRGWREIANAERYIIPKYEKMLLEGKKEYENGLTKLSDLRTAVGSIKRYDSAVFDRSYNSGVVVKDCVADVFNKMKFTMTSLFVIVGLFVCYSAVSRLVHERTILIGTKKALGLYDKEIMLSELAYSFVAAFVGTMLGILVARFVIEPAFMYVVKQNFTYEQIVYHISIPDILIIAAIEIGLTVLATYFACRNVLNRTAIKLLAGEEPPKVNARFYEKTKIWNKMSLFTKTMINNCFNDKRRCFATIIGVAGCTALVVCSITLYDGMTRSLDRQYSNVTKFDTLVYVDQGVENGTENIAKKLDENNIKYSKVYYALGAMNLPNDRQIVGELMVPLDDNFYDFVNLNIKENKNKSQKLLKDSYVCSSYTYFFKSKPGDSLSFVEASGTKYDFVMAGTSEFYTPRTAIFVSEEAYEKAYGSSAPCTAFIINKGDRSISDLTELLGTTDGFMSIGDYYEGGYSEFRVFISISLVLVAVYLVLSFVMALLVLLNLFAMHITEKKKEIIVLLINGFTHKQAKKYVYSDTIILTIIGIFLGIILGALVGRVTIESLCTEASYFILSPDIIAIIAGCLVSTILTVLTAKIALKQIDKFKLTDINKP